MKTLNHTTGVFRERPQDKNAIPLREAAPVFQHHEQLGRRVEGQKTFISRRSMHRYTYAKSSIVRWNRVDQVTMGQRWNYYMNSGKRTPFFKRNEESLPLMAEKMMKAIGERHARMMAAHERRKAGGAVVQLHREATSSPQGHGMAHPQIRKEETACSIARPEDIMQAAVPTHHGNFRERRAHPLAAVHAHFRPLRLHHQEITSAIEPPRAAEAKTRAQPARCDAPAGKAEAHVSGNHGTNHAPVLQPVRIESPGQTPVIANPAAPASISAPQVIDIPESVPAPAPPAPAAPQIQTAGPSHESAAEQPENRAPAHQTRNEPPGESTHAAMPAHSGLAHAAKGIGYFGSAKKKSLILKTASASAGMPI